MKLVLVLGAISAWAVSYIFIYPINNFMVFILCLIFTIDTSILVYLFVPRKCPLKGMSPNEVAKDELDLIGEGEDGSYDEDQKKKLFYYHQLNRYQDALNKVRTINNKRAPNYKIALLTTYALFVLVAGTYFYYKPLVSKSSSPSPVSLGPCK